MHACVAIDLFPRPFAGRASAGCMKSIFSTTDKHRFTQIFPNADLCPSVSICGSLRGTVSRSVRSLFRNRNRNRDRNRNRNRFLFCLAPPGLLTSAQASLPSLVSTATTLPGFSSPNPIPRPRACFPIDLFPRPLAGKASAGCKKSIFQPQITTDPHRFFPILICVHLCPSVVHSAERYPDPSDHCSEIEIEIGIEIGIDSSTAGHPPSAHRSTFPAGPRQLRPPGTP